MSGRSLCRQAVSGVSPRKLTCVRSAPFSNRCRTTPDGSFPTEAPAANSSVFINGKDVPGNSGDQTPTGINVNIAAGTSGPDTIFGAGNHNLTINASALGSYTDGTNTTGNPSIHVLNFSSGDTLYVNNVTVIDTKGTHQV